MKKDLYVSNSGIHGSGIFTKKDIDRGDTIFILKGKRFQKINKTIKDTLGNPNWVGIKKNTWINPAGMFEFINHSCGPNMGIKGSVTFVALRNIKAGEELTFDYSITETDKKWRFNCKCGSRNCRKVVRSVQFLPKKVFNRYSPYVPEYFKKVYNKING